MKKNRKGPFGYGPVILLMGACIVITAVLVFALVVAGNTDRKDVESVVMQDGVTEETGQSGADLTAREIDKTKTEGKDVTEEGSTTASSEVQDTDSTEQREAGENTVSGGDAEALSVSDTETTKEFTVSDKSYFDDALFIGDSRTVGLREYGTLDNADYFASPGLNLYTIDSTKVEIEDGQKIKLEELLAENTYGKVYVMLGINELGYDFDTTTTKYQNFIDYIFTMQPETILYVCANMHVNYLRNELDEIHNNTAINHMNEAIASFADQEKIFYLDVNPLFDDEEGNLAQEYISDDTHLMGEYYEVWCDWYMEHTIATQDW